MEETNFDIRNNRTGEKEFENAMTRDNLIECSTGYFWQLKI